MRLSIVLPCWNRRALCEATLGTILASVDGRGDVEIVIVDDGSEDSERVDYLRRAGPPRVIVARVARARKTHCNPCVAYNIGAHLATGDRLAIQPAECLWTGDIASVALETDPAAWIAFGCYSVDDEVGARVRAAVRSSTRGDVHARVRASVQPMVMDVAREQYVNGWYCHSVHRPIPWNFFATIRRDLFVDIGGFDLRYARGWDHDDEEILHRLARRGIPKLIVDDPFVIHLHAAGHDARKECGTNRALFMQLHTVTDYRANGGRLFTDEFGPHLLEDVG